jgi:hypothetical protein
VNSTDLQSNAFGHPFGQTRSWVGVDNASQNGNGWMLADLPYLNIVRNDYGHTAILQVIQKGGSGAIEFDGSTTFTARGNHKNTLKYIAPYMIDNPSPTPDVYMPGMFEMRDDRGNTWRFYDVPRVSGAIRSDGGYPHEATNQYGTGQNTTNKYQFGAFASYTDASGAYSVTAEYDGTTGNLANIVRTDGSGTYERLHYNYQDMSYTRGGNTTTVSVVRDASMQRASSSGGPWITSRTAQYDYYDGSDGYGRLGDLKLVTISEPASSTSLSISSITHSGTTATATISGHSFSTGGLITIKGASPNAYNGTFKVSGTSGGTVTFELETVPGSNATTAGTSYKHKTIDQKYYRYDKFHTYDYDADPGNLFHGGVTSQLNGMTAISKTIASGSLTHTGTTASAITSTTHGFAVGDWVTISGAYVGGDLSGDYNGLFQITAVPNSTTFQYVMANDPGNNATGTVTSVVQYDNSGGTDQTFSSAGRQREPSSR